MRELTHQEIQFISGADYQDWQVITISAVSSGVAFGLIEAFHSWSLLTGLKFFAVCSLPTAVVSGAFVGSVALYEWMNA